MTRPSDPTVEAVPLSDGDKLRLLARWFAILDDPRNPGQSEVQQELHRIAATLDRSTVPDDPTLDGTDGAHPAWWRGSDHGYAKGLADRSTVPDEGALRAAIAYAIARAPVPSKMDTAGDVAARLAPLVIESGYLSATPKDEPDAPLDGDERFVRLATAVMQLRDFLAMHRKATGRSDVNIRKVIALLDDALSDGDDQVRAALSKESTGG